MSRGVLTALVIAVLAAVGVFAATRDGDDEPTATKPANVDFNADVQQVGSSLRISWSVTNRSDEPLVVVDGREPTQTDNTERAGAYVSGYDERTAEISRRVFPVPEDLEGVQQYGILGSLLAPGATKEGKELVLLPLEFHPAAPEGGGDPLPSAVSRVVFCVGVLPAGDDSSVNRFVRHTPANDLAQTVVCSGAVDLHG